MKKIFALATLVLGVSYTGQHASAGDCCQEGGVSYHGRIVTRIHRTWLGASPAPSLPVFVHQAPPMTAVPFVSAPVYSTLPMVAAAPVAPAAPTAPVAPAATATQQDLDALRSSVDEIRKQVIELAQEVKKIRPAATVTTDTKAATPETK